MDRLRPAPSTAWRPDPPSRTSRCLDRPSRPRTRGTGGRGAEGGPEKRETRKLGCQTRAGLPRTPPAPRSAPGPRSAPRPGRAGEAPAQAPAPSGPVSAAPVPPTPRRPSPASIFPPEPPTERGVAPTVPQSDATGRRRGQSGPNGRGRGRGRKYATEVRRRHLGVRRTQRGGLGPRARLHGGLRRASGDPTSEPPGQLKQARVGSRAPGREREPVVPSGPPARPSCRTDAPRAPCLHRALPVRGAPAHPRRREPWAAPRQVPGIQGAPRAGPGGRAAGGRAPPSCRTAGAAGLAPTSRSRVAARPPLGAVPPGARRGERRAGAWRRCGGPRPEMVICCAAANCSNRQGKGEKRAVSFHR